MRIGVLLLNFGEPETPTMETVVPFLERIFSLNAPLLGDSGSARKLWERSRRLAEARAPDLIAEYQAIGGSPLHGQAREQAEALEAELARRGQDTIVRLGMQFTEPTIGQAVDLAREAGAQVLVGVAVYPLCGPSTSVAALDEMDRAVRARQWWVPVRQVSGWHRHPRYLRLRVDAVRQVLDEHGLSLADPATRLVFSAHGTPQRYLEQGSRYEEYVREFCATLAAALGTSAYAVGYQNHDNRPGVAWTQPDIDSVIHGIEAERVVVDAVSFMHEQSETLAELDDELRGVAEARGLGFYRVPIPHADAGFVEVLADLVQQAVKPACLHAAPLRGMDAALVECHCKPGALCVDARP